MELLDLLFMMTWLEHVLIDIWKKHPLLLYDDAHLHGCTYDMHLSHLKTHGFSCSTHGSFDVGGNSSNTWVKRDMIEENYYWQQHPLLFQDDIHIHRCIDEISLSQLKSSCFICSLFGSYFGRDSSFTSWMKEKMADYYFDAYYILWEAEL